MILGLLRRKSIDFSSHLFTSLCLQNISVDRSSRVEIYVKTLGNIRHIFGFSLLFAISARKPKSLFEICEKNSNKNSDNYYHLFLALCPLDLYFFFQWPYTYILDMRFYRPFTCCRLILLKIAVLLYFGDIKSKFVSWLAKELIEIRYTSKL